MPHHPLRNVEILTEIAEFDLLPIGTHIDPKEETTHAQTGHDVLESGPDAIRHRMICFHPIPFRRVDRSLGAQLMAQRRRQYLASQQDHSIQYVALAGSQFSE